MMQINGISTFPRALNLVSKKAREMLLKDYKNVKKSHSSSSLAYEYISDISASLFFEEAVEKHFANLAIEDKDHHIDNEYKDYIVMIWTKIKSNSNALEEFMTFSEANKVFFEAKKAYDEEISKELKKHSSPEAKKMENIKEFIEKWNLKKHFTFDWNFHEDICYWLSRVVNLLIIETESITWDNADVKDKILPYIKKLKVKLKTIQYWANVEKDLQKDIEIIFAKLFEIKLVLDRLWDSDLKRKIVQIMNILNQVDNREKKFRSWDRVVHLWKFSKYYKESWVVVRKARTTSDTDYCNCLMVAIWDKKLEIPANILEKES